MRVIVEALRNLHAVRSSYDLLLRPAVVALRNRQDWARWRGGKREGPAPHLLKQQVLRQYAQELRLKILVETGTFYADMPIALARDFERIVSVELSDWLSRKAAKRVRRYHHIQIINGDSAEVLRTLCPSLSAPALYWLDGHYSGGVTAIGQEVSPVIAELRAVLGSWREGSAIVIDDARGFGSAPGYPSVAEVRALVESVRDDLDLIVRDDSIRIASRHPALAEAE